MVQEPRIRSEDLDAYRAGRLDEIRPEILDEVKDLVARQSAKKPLFSDAREALNFTAEEPEEL